MLNIELSKKQAAVCYYKNIRVQGGRYLYMHYGTLYAL